MQSRTITLKYKTLLSQHNAEAFVLKVLQSVMVNPQNISLVPNTDEKDATDGDTLDYQPFG